MTSMDRRRAEELLSDYREGTLDAVLRGELEAYLAGDEECRELLAALDDVADALPGLSVPEPARNLAGRAARAALARATVVPFRPALPALLQAAAALAMLVTGVFGLLAGPEAGPARAASRIVQRTGLELREHTDRMVENLRFLRVVVGTAFESRLDRMEERIEDYRELLQERSSGTQPAPTEGRKTSPGTAPHEDRLEPIELRMTDPRNTGSTADAERATDEPRRKS